MNSRPGVLVVVGSFQSIGILRSLHARGVPTYLIDWDLCVGRFSRCADRFSRCPPVTAEDEFLEYLVELADKKGVKGWLIYPNDDRTVAFLARHKAKIEESYRVAVPPWEVARLAVDKRLTYGLAKRIGVPIPRTFFPEGVEALEELDLEYPVILKPAIRDNYYDKARKKAVRVNDRTQLVEEYRKAASLIDPSEIMVQELLPGAAANLYSFGCLYRDGRVLGKVVARRIRQHPEEFGRVTTHAETVHIPELEEMGKRLLDAMGYQGISEVEFMWDPRDARYKLIEINARFWAWHGLAMAAGVDLPYLLYLDMTGRTAAVEDFKDGVKWFRMLVDVPASASLIARRRMSIGAYLNSWKGKRAFSVFSLKDPLPSLAELLMVPYIWKKRGL